MRHPLMPADTPDYMTDAWAGCMSWAVTESAILAAFRADTHITFEPAANAFDRLIDDATGAGDAFCKAFVVWANVHVWGPVDGALSEAEA